MLRRAITAVLLFGVFVPARYADGGTVGPVSDFQDGTTQGWVSGPFNPNPPSVLLNGHGSGNHALQVVGTGSATNGGRVVAFNQSQWAGDYLSDSVSAIAIDFNNIGSTDLDIRLAISGAGGRFSTNSSVFLPSMSGWTNFVFPVEVADWTSAGGFNLNATLSAVNQLRILNNSFPSFMGAIEGGDLLIDNITVVPEPASLTLFALVGLAVAAWTRRG